MPENEFYLFSLHLHFDTPHASGWLMENGSNASTLFSLEDTSVVIKSTGRYGSTCIQEMKAILEEWLAN